MLSGSPQFRGNIEGSFVDPADGKTPVSVKSFTLDAGYFDELSSTVIEWFDAKGKKIGQRTNTILGIERIKIEGGSIAKFRLAIIETEPNGFAIDNFSFEPIAASVLFRKRDDDWWLNRISRCWAVEKPYEETCETSDGVLISAIIAAHVHGACCLVKR